MTTVNADAPMKIPHALHQKGLIVTPAPANVPVIRHAQEISALMKTLADVSVLVQDQNAEENKPLIISIAGVNAPMKALDVLHSSSLMGKSVSVDVHM